MPLLLPDRASRESPLLLFTKADAGAHGIDVRARGWHRLRKGVYVDATDFRALPPWKRYEVRVHAYLRRHPDAILCLESAAVVHGLPVAGETRYVHVYDPDAQRTQCYGDVRVHASATRREICRIGGVHATSLLDTVVDLARVMQPADALAVSDAATSPVQGGALRLDDLIARGKDGVGSRGRARMRWVWDHTNPLAESPPESVSRAVIMWSGYETPVLQREFRYEGHLDRSDFFFESCDAIGECDGWSKYQLEDPGTGALLLAKEKRREDRLRRHGHPFARWEPGDAWKARPLCDALDGAGVRRVATSNPAMLATLRRRPRALPTPRP
ncbi:hypothetical protein [Microbacterium sp. CIAB417]|uniref:hypothetical protein n=1 Tax=Microbacterium sp. CIAB417 TaxID=2860287 RepID=UPI001FAC5B61|nr:hypothetical protein [Microbacterium sp. CIAB417]